jgi:hypothetical protein
MKISESFPARFFKTDDVPSEVEVTITECKKEDVTGSNDPADKKPVLYFSDKKRGLVLNRTNAGILAEAFGDESDNWQGQRVTLYPTTTLYMGKNVPCVRIRVSKSSAVGVEF